MKDSQTKNLQGYLLYTSGFFSASSLSSWSESQINHNFNLFQKQKSEIVTNNPKLKF